MIKKNEMCSKCKRISVSFVQKKKKLKKKNAVNIWQITQTSWIILCNMFEKVYNIVYFICTHFFNITHLNESCDIQTLPGDV